MSEVTGVNPETYLLHVSNLDQTLTEKDMELLFSAFGAVHATRRLMNKLDGTPKGFGFVEMVGKESAEAAIAELDGKLIRTKAIRVTLSNKVEGESQTAGPVRAPINERYKTKVCKNYLMGKCSFGDGCHFVHEAAPRPPPSNPYPTTPYSPYYDYYKPTPPYLPPVTDSRIYETPNMGRYDTTGKYNAGGQWEGGADHSTVNVNNPYHGYEYPTGGPSGWGQPPPQVSHEQHKKGGGYKDGFIRNPDNLKPRITDPGKFRTVPCAMFAEGRCAFGSLCNFIHITPEIVDMARHMSMNSTDGRPTTT